MVYLNQLDYGDIKYEHNLDNGGPSPGHDTIASSGCGLCCLCMVVENLTVSHLNIIECRDMSYEAAANRSRGTDLKILGPVIGERFGLDFKYTDSVDEMMSSIRSGGMAIARACGDRDDYIGVFSHIGHYVLIVSTDGEKLCILDPAYETGKFDEEGRYGKVDTRTEPFLYCSPETLDVDCEVRSPRYFLFKREKGYDKG